MGWPKYNEDNCEIIFERQYYYQEKRKERHLENPAVRPHHTVETDFTVKTIRAYPEPQKEVREDRYLVCSDCGRKFKFTKHAQEEYEKNGWNDPKRCPKCRSLKRISRSMRPAF